MRPSRLSLLEERPASAFSMSRDDIDRLPHLGGDVFRAASLLPGTAANDVTAQLSVHGGRRDEVSILLDGQELYEAFHLKDYDNALSRGAGARARRRHPVDRRLRRELRRSHERRARSAHRRAGSRASLPALGQRARPARRRPAAPGEPTPIATAAGWSAAAAARSISPASSSATRTRASGTCWARRSVGTGAGRFGARVLLVERRARARQARGGGQLRAAGQRLPEPLRLGDPPGVAGRSPPGRDQRVACQRPPRSGGRGRARRKATSRSTIDATSTSLASPRPGPAIAAHAICCAGGWELRRYDAVFDYAKHIDPEFVILAPFSPPRPDEARVRRRAARRSRRRLGHRSVCSCSSDSPPSSACARTITKRPTTRCGARA